MPRSAAALREVEAVTRRAPEAVPAPVARRLLLAGQDLLTEPSRRAGPAALRRCIQKLGYVQLDTINVVERAHHHILFSRFDDHRPAHLKRLHERDRALFEHWTHDACVIPIEAFPHWRHRFSRDRRERGTPGWWARRTPAPRARVLREVRERIEREGPARSADFEHAPQGAAGWWKWKPHKIALEYLWRVGELTVTARDGFQKVYDQTERVFPDAITLPIPRARDHVDWACGGAIERLTVATLQEIRAFYDLVTPADARAWSQRAMKRGEIVEVRLEGMRGEKPKPGFAHPDWRRIAAKLPDAPTRTRVLSPFDPAIRERDRTSRVFGFDYRFEAFVPEAKRKYGYFVLPILEGDRIVGRLDPKLHRDRGELVIQGLWWEPGIDASRERRDALAHALDLYATQNGADRWSMKSR